MATMTGLLQRLLGRLAPHTTPVSARAADVLGAHLRDVVAAGARAKTDKQPAPTRRGCNP